jgi:hypothetical protein
MAIRWTHGKFADVVDLQPFASLAHLTLSGDEPTDQLISSGRSHDRIAVRDDGGALTLERDSVEAGDQRLPTFIALHGDLEARPPAVRGIDSRLTSAGHLRDGRLVLPCQGLEHLKVSMTQWAMT